MVKCRKACLLETGERGVYVEAPGNIPINTFGTVKEFREWLKRESDKVEELVKKYGELHVFVISSCYVIVGDDQQ